MEIYISCLLLIMGFLMLVVGANIFVDGSSALAYKVGIPQIVVGLTVVAMGTSLPEASVSLGAAFEGLGGLSYGNIVGSNIYNILIILGVCACIMPLAMKRSVYVIEIPFLIVVSMLLIPMTLDGILTWVDGVVMLVLFAIYLFYLYVCSRMHRQEALGLSMPWWRIAICVIGGMLLIIYGSKAAVEAATDLAEAIGISERVIGLTIIAAGTSLPELFTSVVATRKRNTDIAIGNIVGSNIFNILFILGVTSVITPVEIEGAFVVDTLITLAVTIILWVAILFSGSKRLERRAGIPMLILYVGYMLYLLLYM